MRNERQQDERWRERARTILARALHARYPAVRGGEAPGAGGPLGRYVWRGKLLFYRPHTKDLAVIYEVLPKARSRGAYWVPPVIRPNVILDIGGHIGIASVYLATLFPTAKIFTFEPVPDNFAILQKNISEYPNIRAFPIALGKKDGAVEIHYPDDPANFGGFSFLEAWGDRSRTLTVEMRRAGELLSGLGITDVDVIKIDAEGAEYDVLTSLDPGVLKRTSWITGELHGERDFELLAYLSRWFDLGVKKSLGGRLMNFDACNKAVAPHLFDK